MWIQLKLKKKKVTEAAPRKSFKNICLCSFQSSHLCYADKDVRCLLLKEVMERIFSCLLEKLMFDGNECGLAETLHGQNHPVGEEAVH